MMRGDGSNYLTIDAVARDRFEAAWTAREPEPLEQFLPADPTSALYLATLEELVKIELEWAWKSGRCPPGGEQAPPHGPLVEEYLRRFPPLVAPEITRRLLRQEHRVRNRQYGDKPGIAVYQARFPHLGLS